MTTVQVKLLPGYWIGFVATGWRGVGGGAGVVPDSCEYLVIEEHQGTEWNQTSEHKSADVNVEPKPNTLIKFKN